MPHSKTTQQNNTQKNTKKLKVEIANQVEN